MAEAPATDADVPAFAAALGVPGLVDVHTHFIGGFRDSVSLTLTETGIPQTISRTAFGPLVSQV